MSPLHAMLRAVKGQAAAGGKRSPHDVVVDDTGRGDVPVHPDEVAYDLHVSVLSAMASLGVRCKRPGGRVTVVDVVADGPAAAVGITVGDVLCSIGGVAVRNQQEIAAAVMRTVEAIPDGPPFDVPVRIARAKRRETARSSPKVRPRVPPSMSPRDAGAAAADVATPPRDLAAVGACPTSRSGFFRRSAPPSAAPVAVQLKRLQTAHASGAVSTETYAAEYLRLTGTPPGEIRVVEGGRAGTVPPAAAPAGPLPPEAADVEVRSIAGDGDEKKDAPKFWTAPLDRFRRFRSGREGSPKPACATPLLAAAPPTVNTAAAANDTTTDVHETMSSTSRNGDNSGGDVAASAAHVDAGAAHVDAVEAEVVVAEEEEEGCVPEADASANRLSDFDAIDHSHLLDQETLDALRRHFLEADLDGDLALTREEIYECFLKIGMTEDAAAQTANHALQVADVSGDGLISYDEWVAWHIGAYGPADDGAAAAGGADANAEDMDIMDYEFPDGVLADLQEGFVLMDDNGDGVVTVEEIEDFLNERGYDTANFMARALMAQADKDGNGEIGYVEFVSNALNRKRKK